MLTKVTAVNMLQFKYQKIFNPEAVRCAHFKYERASLLKLCCVYLKHAYALLIKLGMVFVLQ